MDRLERRIAVAAAVFAAGMVLHYTADAGGAVELAVFGTAYIVIGYDILWKAARNIGHGNFLDENFLMAVATLGAFAIQMYPEGTAVMLFFQIGEWFERKATGRTRQSIAALMDIQPEFAHVVRGGAAETVNPEDVSVGETIEVLPGERVPLDGRVVEGRSSLDTRALTGESVPRDIGPGDEIVSGTVNLSAKLTVSVTKGYEDSTVAKVLELVEDSTTRKAPAEKFITRFARYYTPAVVGAAVVIAAVPPLLGQDFVVWLYRALTFLVVSCPCALVISVPLSYFCGIGAASRMGVLVKGASYMEALSRVHTVVFDKTGTLTKGSFEISRVHSSGIPDQELIDIASAAESASNHPISKSIQKAGSGSVSSSDVSEAREIGGKGVEAVICGSKIMVGNHRLMADHGIPYCDEQIAGTNVHVAKDGRYLGHIVVSDVVKDDSEEAIAGLRALDVERTVMLSGDAERICRDVGGRLGIDEVVFELLPGDKTAELERLMAECPKGRTTAFVGDGINDAPSLARADIGIAMGGLGSDAAIEAADVVIMNDAPSRIPGCIRLARKTNRIVYENIAFALAVKFGIMALALVGIADMWLAVFGDVGVTILAVLNAMRCMRLPSGADDAEPGARTAASDARSPLPGRVQLEPGRYLFLHDPEIARHEDGMLHSGDSRASCRHSRAARRRRRRGADGRTHALSGQSVRLRGRLHPQLRIRDRGHEGLHHSRQPGSLQGGMDIIRIDQGALWIHSGHRLQLHAFGRICQPDGRVRRVLQRRPRRIRRDHDRELQPIQQRRRRLPAQEIRRHRCCMLRQRQDWRWVRMDRPHGVQEQQRLDPAHRIGGHEHIL